MEGGGAEVGSSVSQERRPLPPTLLFCFNWPQERTYLHDDEEVEDQDEGGQKCSGDLIAGQKAPV